MEIRADIPNGPVDCGLFAVNPSSIRYALWALFCGRYNICVVQRRETQSILGDDGLENIQTSRN